MRHIKRNPFEVQVNLTNNQINEVWGIAQIRQEIKDKNPGMAKDKRIILRDDLETHALGVSGEYVVAPYVGKDLDRNGYLGGDNHYDFILYGQTIEVKTLQGYLLFNNLKHFAADIAVLVIYDTTDTARLAIQGFITKAIFEKEHFTTDLGHGSRCCLQPIELHPIHGLKTYCLVRSHLIELNKIMRKESENVQH